MPTARVLSLRQHTNIKAPIVELAHFLNDQLGSPTGPGWTLIEAYDGSSRDTPTGGTKFENLPGSHGWHPNNTGSLGSGVWCVLESLDANNTNHFQIWLQYGGLDLFHLRLIPFADFTTGGAATSTPTMPSTSFGDGGTTDMEFDINANITSSVVADEGMCAFMFDNGVNGFSADSGFGYFGELRSIYSNDPRCYVMRTRTELYLESFGFDNWCRLSPMDNETFLTTGRTMWVIDSGNNRQPGGDSGASFSLGPRARVFDTDIIWPTGVEYAGDSVGGNAGHRHYPGWLRNVYVVHPNLGISGTLGSGSADFYFRSTNADDGSTDPPWCIVWDGTVV